MCDFENKVKINIDNIIKNSCQSKAPRLGLAVSGGADSVSLLLSLSCFFTPLYVITVNHNIRPAEESRGDADFVLDLCKRLSGQDHEIICQLVELERGSVEAEAQKRGGGVEEAARYLRYQAFEAFVAEHNLDALCTAHTQNDQLETLLMRFLQGGSTESAAGIMPWRPVSEQKAVYARPLLGFTRAEIEAYVRSRGFSWCTDKTNLETDYLRNKIRLKLVPFLDENFNGWQKALLSGAEKAREDSELILSCFEKTALVESDGTVKINLVDFQNSPPAIQRRLLLSACNRTGENTRIPNQFINDVLAALKSEKNCDFTKHYAALDIIKEKNNLFVKKHSESNTDFVFSDIIDKSGSFEFPSGTLDVFNYRELNGKRIVSVRVRAETGAVKGPSSELEELSLPFCIRSARPGDLLLCADGSEKKVSDIFADWHVPSEKRNLLPVIQILDENPQRIIALLGRFSGYKDWIVKL